MEWKGFDEKLKKIVTPTYRDVESLKKYIKQHFEKKYAEKYITIVVSLA